MRLPLGARAKGHRLASRDRNFALSAPYKRART
jgi:hypothetical protein